MATRAPHRQRPFAQEHDLTQAGPSILHKAGAGALALAALVASAGVAQAQEFLPQMSYPAVVEQGQTFTLSGTDCVGRVAGSFEDGSDWSDLDLVANGSWSVELTVAADAPIGEFDWDMQCINDAGNPRYPFSSMEIVPAGTLETTTTTTTTTVTPTSPVPTSAAAPTTAKARPTTALPSYTG